MDFEYNIQNVETTANKKGGALSLRNLYSKSILFAVLSEFLSIDFFFGPYQAASNYHHLSVPCLSSLSPGNPEQHNKIAMQDNFIPLDFYSLQQSCVK